MKVLTTSNSGTQRILDERVAKVLQAKGKLTYETRMLSSEVAATPAPAPAPAPAPQPDVELDANGDAWDEALHVSTKTKTADGAWRKKPGRAFASE